LAILEAAMSTAALLSADFATTPYDHQFKEFEEHCNAPARAKAWHMRTGKSKASVDKAMHLHLHGGDNGKIDGVLVFAPNGVHANWVLREFPAHAWPGVGWHGHVWRSSVAGAKRGNALGKAARVEWEAERQLWWDGLRLAKDTRKLMVLAVPTESMTRADVRKAVAHFLKHRRAVYVLFDESDDWGTPGSKRTKMARALSKRCAYRELMSGTIATACPLATFSQFELLEPGALGFTRADDFNDRYGEYEEARGHGGRKFAKLVGYKHLDELRARMARFTSVVLRSDCNMPDLVPITRTITPTEEQLAAYRDLHASFIVDLEAERVNVGERAPRFGKLQQVFSGFLIDEAGKRVTIPGGNPRLEAIAEEVYLAPGKVVIACQFQEDMDLVRERLLVEGHELAEYHGRVPDKAKVKALATFLNRRECKALIGHVKSISRGLDFSVASSIFVYSHNFSARLRAQFLERATKIGGKNTRVVDFVAPGPDEHILKVTSSHMDVADSLVGHGLKELLKGMEL
jgi:hypothetical protein